MKPVKQDLYSKVTNQIINAMETAGTDWLCQWSKEGTEHFNAQGRGYRGINTVLLWASTIKNGFKSHRWLTYKQAQELGANVRKGEKGTMVVFNAPVTFENEETQEEKKVWIFKGYVVFNADQIDNLPQEYTIKPERPEGITISGQHAFDAIVQNSGALIRHGGDRAYFSPNQDYIAMPDLWRWKKEDDYRAVLAHELTHWTGHKSRLDRKMNSKFGDEAYAFEELIAELGSAFLCSATGITNDEPRPDHAKYLNSWLNVLKKDKTAIFKAASAAQKATDWLLNAEPMHMLYAAE